MSKTSLFKVTSAMTSSVSILIHRVVFLFLKQFSFELETDADVFLMLLTEIIGEEAGASVDNSSYPRANRPRASWL